MIYLTHEQRSFLIKLSKSQSIGYNLILKDLEVAKFLVEKELAKFEKERLTRINPDTHKLENYDGKIISISISEPGKAYLAERRAYIRDKWVPYVITTIISVLALAKSYGFGIDDIFTWCMQLLKQ